MSNCRPSTQVRIKRFAKMTTITVQKVEIRAMHKRNEIRPKTAGKKTHESERGVG